MAPRGRPRKNAVGQTRMDAALDAMRPYGFPESLVRPTVKELLDVYGGNDGWMFIEEAAYMLLIETLLAKQNRISDHDEGDAGRVNSAKLGASSAGGTPPSAVSFHVSAKLEPSDAISHADNTASTIHGSATLGLGGGLAASVIVKEETMERTLSCSPPPLKSASASREESFLAPSRRPHYGWISSDDEDEGEDDMVELPAAPLPCLACRDR